MAPRFPLFATTSRGTEDLLADELRELGAARVKQDRGGVRFAANLDEALRMLGWSRLSMRVLWQLGEFDAPGADGLYEAARQVPWEEHLTAETTFKVEATLKGSEHAHSGFVALKLKDAIVDRLRERQGSRPNVDTRNPDVTVVAHLAGTTLSLSLDLAGEPLNRRGYRVAKTEAPMKETLAAAVLRAARYTGDEPVLDPMCGSGTLLIEAGLIAVRRAPGLHRRFAVEKWTGMGEDASARLQKLKDEARAHERQAPFPLYGFDRDEDALAAVQRNVQAARLSREIRIERGDATGRPDVPLEPPGLLVTNPPYGDRLAAGGQKGMKSFYYKLGESLGALQGWRMAVLSGNEAFEAAFHRKPSGSRELWNGPIECELLFYPPRGGVPPPRT